MDVGDERGESRVPPLRYRAIVRLLAPLLTAHLLLRARRDGGARYARERLGLGEARGVSRDRSSEREVPERGASERRPGTRPWVHAASVGEVMTVLPLLRALLDHGADTVLVTTNTPTGADVLARHGPEGARHRYLPIDWPGATRRFLERERPSSGWIVETEIWPWLYARCKASGVPLSIVNARLSVRTLRHVDGSLAPVYRRALAGIDVLARSEADAGGYRALGAEAARVRVVGDLKFAGGAVTDAAASTPPSATRLVERPYVLAASTHADEERRLAAAWRATRADGLLVIVPRHPERGAALARELPDDAPPAGGRSDGGRPGAEPSRCARRSLGETPPADARLHLGDTLGELDAWYADAAGAFVGGSLVERGGHNVLEPARRGCPVVVGPHTENFADAVAALRSASAIETADGAEAVARFLSRALDGDEALSRQGERAREVSAGAADIVSRYLAVLRGGLEEPG